MGLAPAPFSRDVSRTPPPAAGTIAQEARTKTRNGKVRCIARSITSFLRMNSSSTRLRDVRKVFGQRLWNRHLEEPRRLGMNDSLAARGEKDGHLFQATPPNKAGEPAQHPLLDVRVRVFVNRMVLRIGKVVAIEGRHVGISPGTKQLRRPWIWGR